MKREAPVVAPANIKRVKREVVETPPPELRDPVAVEFDAIFDIGVPPCPRASSK